MTDEAFCRIAVPSFMPDPPGRIMRQAGIQVTRPILHDDASVWFSVFGFGWGYRAYAVSVDTVCKELGAANTTPGQIGIAFELGKQKILRAIEQLTPTGEGKRVNISPAELARV
jgi:hypothetical protein